MAKFLVHVDKTRTWEVVFPEANIRQRHPRALLPRAIEEDGDYQQADFYEIEEADKDAFIAELTKKNAGVAVRVYVMIEESIRPPGDLVTKSVTKDGVLPK